MALNSTLATSAGIAWWLQLPAKNTLYMNYLPFAAKNGTDIFTQVK
jgi:hypothetical protein